MIALIQRVNRAEVRIDGHAHAQIDAGLLALIGMRKGDDPAKAEQLIDRVLAYRVFADSEGRMNLSLRDTGGGLLLVSQFTLAADTRSGLRPSFSPALPSGEAEPLWEALLRYTDAQHAPVRSGRFGADMQVALENNGPVTFWLEV
ncbi:MAG: D-aminoacyl-tRNA deacylase [Pseudohongiellaceae bacterium]